MHYGFPSGCRDGTISPAAEATGNLPMANYVTTLEENFGRKGLSLEVMATLSGAHSIGGSHCSNVFSPLYYSFNSNYSQDPFLDHAYANYLRSKCPRISPSGPNNQVVAVVSFDPSTPKTLDNHYYKNWGNHEGLLFSDQVLFTTTSTRKMVKNNAKHGNLWACKFAAAMVHMGSIEVVTARGEIRKKCGFVNLEIF
ncbi:hypothetical protein ACH5RR_033470 [Cinchona calisaya]|uniref:peroxidase n=1 Tax=Cinchona calisaya TaxID=153742 RepID=A0ABD2YM81_9GENT